MPRRLVIAPLLVIVALLAAWIVPPLLDWNSERAAIAAFAAAGLGRPVRIDGPIRLSLLPTAVLRAGRVTIGDTGDGVSATVAQLRLRIALMPLLAGRVAPEELVLERPAVRLPWPLAAALPSKVPAGLHARVERGSLTVGAVTLTGIDGELALDPVTGTLSAAGSGTVFGRAWHITGRLGQAGRDGAATLEVSLDGQGPTAGTGALVAGLLDAQGGVTGRISARGPDLAVLLAAPAVPWRAEGRLSAGSGLVVADQLELSLADVPARGAVALRLLPHLRLDAALAASRLDLDAWLPPLLHAAPVQLPTGIDISAESATLAGGTLRSLRAGFELAGSAATLRDADAILPGDATLHLTGTLAAGLFTGTANLSAPALAQTVAWLRPLAPGLVRAFPPAAQHSASLAATLQADASRLSLDVLRGDWNGAPLAGRLTLQRANPEFSATLRLDGPVLDALAPDGLPTPASLAKAIGGLNADVTLSAIHPLWHGVALDRLDLSARCVDGVLDVRHAAIAAPGIAANLSGRVSTTGHLDAATLSLRMQDAARAAALLPPSLAFAGALVRGPATLAATASGDLASLAVTLQAGLSDAALAVDGRVDLPGHAFQGQVSLRHPGAPRLLYGLGLGDVAGWLGEGSLSAQSAVTAAPGRIALSGLTLTAGALRASADLAFTGLDQPRLSLTGSIAADTLPLPPVHPGATAPLPLAPLSSLDATLSLRAAHVLAGLHPVLDDAAATLSVAGDTLSLDHLTGTLTGATLAGGALAGHASLQATSPPRLALSARLTGAALGADGLAGTPLDIASGTLDAAADVTATGFSPAAMLATLAGPVRLVVRDGTLTGIDAAGALAVLAGLAPSPTAVAAALREGRTPFSRLEIGGTIARGDLTVESGLLTAASGSIALSGSLDLPSRSLDARLALRPAVSGAPTLGLRLIGPADAPSRVPDLTDLARWIAAR